MNIQSFETIKSIKTDCYQEESEDRKLATTTNCITVTVTTKAKKVFNPSRTSVTAGSASNRAVGLKTSQ